MDSLRRRTPFSFSDDAETDGPGVLDEQEQEQIIDALRNENTSAQRQYAFMTSILLVLSLLLQVVFIFTTMNPLEVIFPPSSSKSTSIPLSMLFAVINIFLHLDMLRAILPSKLGISIQLSNTEIPTLPNRFRYALAGVAPTLSLLLTCSWQVTIWWLFTPGVILILQGVQQAISHGAEMIIELEAKKYTAPGA